MSASKPRGHSFAPVRGRPPFIAVLGSANLDLVASAPRLPVPGETVSGATLRRFPGGKGANQALAAKRLGAKVALVARVGRDAHAEEALAMLRHDGVDVSACTQDPEAATGVALICVAPGGENQIVVAPGANRTLTPEHARIPDSDGLICQLEVPAETIAHCVRDYPGFFCLNIAPAAPVPEAVLKRTDLVVMNETEAAAAGDSIRHCAGLVAITRGASGAELMRAGQLLARSRPPQIEAVDTTGAGDTFTAALTVGLLEGMEPQAALDFACHAGALAATRPGAQPSFPWRDELQEKLEKT